MTENIYVEAVNQVPKGETRSFGEIAVMAGKPKAPRAAGRALTSYPVDGKAAWHRAVTTFGGLSIDPERARVQLERLRKDGARPRADESVAEWMKRVRAPFVADYKSGLYVEFDHPRIKKFDPLFVERIECEADGVERGFQLFEDREPAIREVRDTGEPEKCTRRKTAKPSKKKRSRR